MTANPASTRVVETNMAGERDESFRAFRRRVLPCPLPAAYLLLRDCGDDEEVVNPAAGSAALGHGQTGGGSIQPDRALGRQPSAVAFRSENQLGEEALVPFSSGAEILTYMALTKGLSHYGYRVSQKVRAIDALEAAAARHIHIPIDTRFDPETVAIFRRFNSFGDNHPWLAPGDRRFAFRSHFDFVVQAPLGSEQPLEPLFAVEFDGYLHSGPKALARDLAKNRLCAAAGLRLVRVSQPHLFQREHVTIVEWLAELWAAQEAEMPAMLAERDEEVRYAKENLDHRQPRRIPGGPEPRCRLRLRAQAPLPAGPRRRRALGQTLRLQGADGQPTRRS
jgi:Protein of unknown function (DUF2726)